MNRTAKSRVTRRTLLIAGSSSMVAAGILGACAPFGSDETAPEFTETTSAVGLSERAAREPVWTSTGEVFSGPPAAQTNPEVGEEFQLAQETGALRLYVDPGLGKIVVEDKRSGKLWRSNPVEPAKRKTLLQNAVFLLNFTNDRLQMTNLASSASEEPELRIEKLDGGGIRGIFNLTKRKITLALDLRLTDDYLEVSIPDDQIEERGSFRVVSIEVLRRLCDDPGRVRGTRHLQAAVPPVSAALFGGDLWRGRRRPRFPPPDRFSAPALVLRAALAAHLGPEGW